MSTERTRDLPRDEALEATILHWERYLNDSLQAVRTAQRTLESLYPHRYETVVVELGHTAFSQHIIDEAA